MQEELTHCEQFPLACAWITGVKTGLSQRQSTWRPARSDRERMIRKKSRPFRSPHTSDYYLWMFKNPNKLVTTSSARKWKVNSGHKEQRNPSCDTFCWIKQKFPLASFEMNSTDKAPDLTGTFQMQCMDVHINLLSVDVASIVSNIHDTQTWQSCTNDTGHSSSGVHHSYCSHTQGHRPWSLFLSLRHTHTRTHTRNTSLSKADLLRKFKQCNRKSVLWPERQHFNTVSVGGGRSKEQKTALFRFDLHKSYERTSSTNKPKPLQPLPSWLCWPDVFRQTSLYPKRSFRSSHCTDAKLHNRPGFLVGEVGHTRLLFCMPKSVSACVAHHICVSSNPLTHCHHVYL